MTDLEVRGGGAIAVDTETLRRTASRFAAADAALESIGLRLDALQRMLLTARDGAGDVVSAAAALADRLRSAREGAAALAEALRQTVAVYELVELDAAWAAALLAGDRAATARIDLQRRRLRAEHPAAAASARVLAAERAVMWPSELVRQATLLGADAGLRSGGAIPGGAAGSAATFGMGALGLATAAGISAQGRIARDARLRGSPPPVVVIPVDRAPAAAPATLASAAARIPSGGDARVRVERYTMADGSRQFAVYVTGTQSWTAAGAEPWDAASNAELYSGTTSASYAATTEALAAAGAQRGDTVHAFGFSQGAMITARLALEGEYEVATLVSVGSPVEADVGPQTLSVGIRHTDDPVAALAGGGHAGAVGAPGSFVVEAPGDPKTGVSDLGMPTHSLDAYVATAGRVDASGDPRVDAVRTLLDELGTAARIDAVEFGAVRVDPDAAGACAVATPQVGSLSPCGEGAG